MFEQFCKRLKTKTYFRIAPRYKYGESEQPKHRRAEGPESDVDDFKHGSAPL